MKFEKSCGVIVFKEEENDLYVLLVHHNEGHWGIPKGHMEDDESEEETAIREVYEETGIKCEITSDFRETITYLVNDNIQKEVVFFIGKQVGGILTNQENEVQEAVWLEISTAIETITHDDLKQLLKNAILNYQNR